MVVKEEHQQVIRLLRDTVTLLCKNGLKYKTNINVEGLIGVTVDDEDVFLVSIKDSVGDGLDTMSGTPSKSKDKDKTPSKSKRDKDVINLTDDDDVSERRRKRQRGNDDVIVVREEPMSPSHRIAANQAARQGQYGRAQMGRTGGLTQIRPRFPAQQQYYRGQQMYQGGRGQYPFRSPTRPYYPQMGRGGNIMNQQQLTQAQQQYLARFANQQQMGPGRPPMNQMMQQQQMQQQQPQMQQQQQQQQMQQQQQQQQQQQNMGQGQFNTGPTAAAGSPAQASAQTPPVSTPTEIVQVAPVTSDQTQQSSTSTSSETPQNIQVVQPQESSESTSDNQTEQSQENSDPFPTAMVTQIVPITETENNSASNTPVFSPLSDQPRESPGPNASGSDSSSHIQRDSRADLEQLEASLEELQASINSPRQRAASTDSGSATAGTSNMTPLPQDSPTSQVS